MKILSFTERWRKLEDDELTTIRPDSTYWNEGDHVQVWFRNRSPKRYKLGEADILSIEKVAIEFRNYEMETAELRLLTDEEAAADGFPGGREELNKWMVKTYRCNYEPVMQILTIRWTMKCEGVF